ncbi:MAG: phosphoribosyltransferase [Proteobacteria bacterium]|nr:phosphoribosyltransferase [Pseudomonadota bacterium]
MAAEVTEEESLRNKTRIFRNRLEAGDHLARRLEKYRHKEGLVLAIPSGGIPIGLRISQHLELPLDLVISRKIPIPGNPEAGFGAVSFERSLFLNEPLVRELQLTPDEIQKLSTLVVQEIQHRNAVFRGGRPFPDLRRKIVIVVDDGLASGYTMMASINFIKKRSPSRVVVAIPTAPESSVQLISAQVEEILCLNIRRGFFFAVADAYHEWHDLSEEEVMEFLKQPRSP